jgi:glycosyltransferase involved in cell wall biosynthesis
MSATAATEGSGGPIVHVVQQLGPGGLEVMALELAAAQTRRRETLVVSLEATEAFALERWPRLRRQADRLLFLGKRPGLDPWLPFRLAVLFRRLRPACVHTHHIGPLLYAGLAARLAGVPRLLHTEHDAWHLGDARRRRVMRLALALARPVVVADAPHVAEALATAFGGPSPPVVLNGVDTNRFRPGDRRAARSALGLPLDRPVIGIAARLERVKGVDLAIAAMARVPGPAVLAIAGHGTERDALQAQVAEARLGERVRFVGQVQDMAGFYQALDVLCVPSRAEGLPLAPLEAQACGVPVVATAVGGVPQALCPATGRLVPAEDPQALADALAQAASAAAGEDRRRGDPREFVLCHATLEAAAGSYLNLALGTRSGR